MKAYSQPPNSNGNGHGHGHGHDVEIAGWQGMGMLFLACIVYGYIKSKLRKL
jgi:hypothetical protein